MLKEEVEVSDLMGHVLGLGYTSLSFLFSSLHSHLSGSHVNERPPSPQSHREQTMIPHLLPRPSPSRFHRIGSIRLVRSVQDPAQGQELLLRHVPLLQRRDEDVHPRRRPFAARLLSFNPGNNKVSIFGLWVLEILSDECVIGNR